MPYCKITKKYSHCQYMLPFSWQRGFFIIEFVYTLFVVTSFVGVISLYLVLNIRWQQWASNHLIALTMARDTLENTLLEKSLVNTSVNTSKNDQFTIKFNQTKLPLSYHIPYLNKRELLVNAANVVVTWLDDTKYKHRLTLESYW